MCDFSSCAPKIISSKVTWFRQGLFYHSIKFFNINLTAVAMPLLTAPASTSMCSFILSSTYSTLIHSESFHWPAVSYPAWPTGDLGPQSLSHQDKGSNLQNLHKTRQGGALLNLWVWSLCKVESLHVYSFYLSLPSPYTHWETEFHRLPAWWVPGWNGCLWPPELGNDSIFLFCMIHLRWGKWEELVSWVAQGLFWLLSSWPSQLRLVPEEID